MRLSRVDQRGDTIVEVLFAVAVFAMVAVGSLLIMNQGTASALRSLEITLVRQQVDAQAEAIRYIHQAYISSYEKGGVAPAGTAAQWKEMTDPSKKGASAASSFGIAADATTCPRSTPGEKPFIVNARQAIVASNVPMMMVGDSAEPPFAQVVYNDASNTVNQAYGIWVEAIPSQTTDGPGFVDFHIRACWDSPGSNVPATIGTIVRLYEPR